MVEIPRAVLSERFQELMNGRRLVSAVFLTYRLDPAFFEEEVLPVFLDVPLSHAPAIKRVQLEDALRTIPGSIAVYYDFNGLVPEAQSAKLDIKRIKVQHRHAIFHPKNVFALVEDVDPAEDGSRPRALLVACLSANLTQSGWWENVEVCHVEELGDGDPTRLRADLRRFINALLREHGDKDHEGHKALRDIHDFLSGTEQRSHRSSKGRLHTHFFDGSTTVVDFLEKAAGPQLRNMNLEVISPYFDDAPTSGPLEKLIDHFQPREVRVFLPRKDTGEATCDARIYEWVRTQDRVSWARLPKDLLRRGTSEDVRARFVHAKVYRFFSSQPKREILFIGSPNLTTAAHGNGGNLETGFLVEIEPTRRPDWWTIPDQRRPPAFERQLEDDRPAASGGTRLSLRFWWDKELAEVYWEDRNVAPRLSIECQGVTLFSLESVPCVEWTPLPFEDYHELKRVLQSTSLLSVLVEGSEPGLLLVQEEGMSHRPSLLFDLSASEILRYWSLLTVEQRSAFLEARAPEKVLEGDDAALVAKYAPLNGIHSFFDGFAGIFHAFGCMERNVREALRDGKVREANYRLFGQKYDSLGSLLARIEKDVVANADGAVGQYVTLLCARQLIQELRREHPDYWKEHADDDRRLRQQLEVVSRVRGRLVERDPEGMRAFLDWFEPWFLKKAAPVQLEEVA